MNEPKVKLSYRLKGTTGWMEHELTADEYYEPEEGGRTWDSVPLHLHANEYLEVKPSQLEQTVLRIHDGAGALRCTVREIFWNEGRNRLIQRIDDDGMLLILEIRTGTCPEMLHSIRYDCTPPQESIIEHFIQAEGADDSETVVSMTIRDIQPLSSVALFLAGPVP